MQAAAVTKGRGWALATSGVLAAALVLVTSIVFSDAGAVTRAESEAVTLAEAASGSPDADRKAAANDARRRAAMLRRQLNFGYGAMTAAAIGVATLVGGALSEKHRAWCWGAGVLPIVYLVLYAVPGAMSGAPWPVVGLVVSLMSAGAYVGVVRQLGHRVQYGVSLGALATIGLFFQVWEPPPPKPVPLVKSFVENFPRTLAGWRGMHGVLDKALEEQLGADEYLNLQLRSPEGDREGGVFITYNANAMSNVPHVPWVCMTQAGFVKKRQDVRDIVIPSMKDKEIPVNVLYFEPKPGVNRPPALMLQYFNVGGRYTTSRELARFLGTTGSLGQKGSYLSQTQVMVWLKPDETEDPMAKDSAVYRQALMLLNEIVPLLEKEYYPDLGGSEGD
ncbi:MAG: exosortase-associated EpsI family protein [Phycisphaerae bacterium]